MDINHINYLTLYLYEIINVTSTTIDRQKEIQWNNECLNKLTLQRNKDEIDYT